MRRAALVALAGWLMMGGSADAANIDINWTGGVNVTVNLEGVALPTLAGDFEITVLDNSLAPALVSGQSFYTFCVDLQHYATTSANATLDSMSNWTITGGVPPGGASATYPTASNTEGRHRAAYLGSHYFSSYPLGAPENTAGNIIAAAYQIAIWELLYENDNDFNPGVGNISFDIHAAVLTAAVGLITDSAEKSARTGWLITANPDSTHGQDFMAPVPEPLSSLGAFAFALLSLSVARRRLGT